MRFELDKQLCEKYPKIFAGRHGKPTETLMCFGFEHGDGWYNIIDALCFNIQRHVDSSRKRRASALRMNRKIKKAIQMNSIEPIANVYQGSWWQEKCEKILQNKEYEKVPEKVHQVVAVQVKEKFGGLRFYTNYSDNVVNALISMAESMSYRTCEVCGTPGKSRHGGWIRTLCDEHAEGRDYFNDGEN